MHETIQFNLCETCEGRKKGFVMSTVAERNLYSIQYEQFHCVKIMKKQTRLALLIHIILFVLTPVDGIDL